MEFYKTLRMYDNILKKTLWMSPKFLGSVQIKVPFSYDDKTTSFAVIATMTEQEKENAGVGYFTLEYGSYGFTSWDWDVYKYDEDGDIDYEELEDIFEWQSTQDAVHILFGQMIENVLPEVEKAVVDKYAIVKG